jgi:hypothetical protein
MGAMSNIVGAARALAGLVAQEQNDRLVAAENERERLDAEVGMLRKELARLREVLERERLDVREAMARNGALLGETLAVFVARLVDSLASARANERRAIDFNVDEMERMSDVVDHATAALRPVAPGKQEGLVGMAQDVAREYAILRDQGKVDRVKGIDGVAVYLGDESLAVPVSSADASIVVARRMAAVGAPVVSLQRGGASAGTADEDKEATDRVDEWEQAVTEERSPVVDTPQVCRTCRSIAAGSDVRLPGAQGLCTALYVTTGSAVNASLYQLDSRPKACPGWRCGQ